MLLLVLTQACWYQVIMEEIGKVGCYARLLRQYDVLV